jgi:hypothetical protein
MEDNMTLDEQDVVNAVLDRLYLALASLGAGYTEGPTFSGALWTISDATDALEGIMKKENCAGAS